MGKTTAQWITGLARATRGVVGLNPGNLTKNNASGACRVVLLERVMVQSNLPHDRIKIFSNAQATCPVDPEVWSDGFSRRQQVCPVEPFELQGARCGCKKTVKIKKKEGGQKIASIRM